MPDPYKTRIAPCIGAIRDSPLLLGCRDRAAMEMHPRELGRCRAAVESAPAEGVTGFGA